MRQHMTADRYGEYAIGNIYCDTDNFRLIRASLEKPAYKEKAAHPLLRRAKGGR